MDHNNAVDKIKDLAEPIAIFIGLFGLKDALPKLWGWLGRLINSDRERQIKKEDEDAKARRAIREELLQEKKEEDARIVSILTQQLQKQEETLNNTIQWVKDDYKERIAEMRTGFEKSLELINTSNATTISKQDETIRELRKQVSSVLESMTGIKQDAKDAKQDASIAKMLSTPENLVELAKRAKAEGLVDPTQPEV